MSIRDKILALKSTIPTATMTIGGIGEIHLRGLTAGERDSWEQAIYLTRGKITGMKNLRASLVVRCLIDETGARIFSDSDIDELGAIPAKIVDKLYEKCQVLSGLREDDIVELEKNFVAAD